MRTTGHLRPIAGALCEPARRPFRPLFGQGRWRLVLQTVFKENGRFPTVSGLRSAPG
jgi:hypothetical protein